jgi:hypothetical protein
MRWVAASTMHLTLRQARNRKGAYLGVDEGILKGEARDWHGESKRSACKEQEAYGVQTEPHKKANKAEYRDCISHGHNLLFSHDEVPVHLEWWYTRAHDPLAIKSSSTADLESCPITWASYTITCC